MKARGTRPATHAFDAGSFIRAVTLKREHVPSFDEYPFNIPAVAKLKNLAFHKHVTFFVGENGSGKSTLVEAIAVVAGYNAEGGSKTYGFSTRSSESTLQEALGISRGIPR